MPTLNFKLQTSNMRVAGVLLGCFVCFLFASNGAAQIQQAWVARYNNGITSGTNQAVKMVLDPAGNLYVTGFSQNTNGNLDYATIKYAPNGTQLWASRFDSTNTVTALPAGIVLDGSNNVIITGTALTVKYDMNGNQFWTAPYTGTSVAVDTNCNVYVVGFSTNFGTVKLNGAGSNVWQATYPPSFGSETRSRLVAVDSKGNVDVAGINSVFGGCEGPHCLTNTPFLLIQYDANGNQNWVESGQISFSGVHVDGLVLDSAANIYVIADASAGQYDALKYAVGGSETWTTSPDNGTGPANGLALDNRTNVLLVGQDAYQFNGAYSYYYSTFKLNSIGTTLWANHYPQPPFGSSVATSIAVDSADSVYVTGYSPGTNSANNIVTIKYDQNGNQIWLQRYQSPSGGNAAGNAIAVDNNGNVYVAGYDTVSGGGTEMVLIKYSPVTIQRRSDGTIQLQAEGSPGQNFDFQASTNLQTWQDLGNVTADTNGVAQFDDTNAPNFNWRFYLTVPH